MTNKTTASTLLQEGQDILKARAALRDSDDGERSMARAVAIFNAWTDSTMSEENGWRFMIALKQAREIQGDFHKDDYVDLASYSALLGECESSAENVPEALKEYVFPSDDEFYEMVHKGGPDPVTKPVVDAPQGYNHTVASWVQSPKDYGSLQSFTDAELATFKAEAYSKPVYNTEVAAFFGKGQQQ